MISQYTTNYFLHMYSALSSFPNIYMYTLSGAAQLPCEDSRIETLIPTGAGDLASLKAYHR